MRVVGQGTLKPPFEGAELDSVERMASHFAKVTKSNDSKQLRSDLAKSLSSKNTQEPNPKRRPTSVEILTAIQSRFLTAEEQLELYRKKKEIDLQYERDLLKLKLEFKS
jgi:hypothetical protein